MIRFRFIAAALIVALMLTVPVQAYATKPSSVPYSSQPGVANIQASYPVVGGATDKTGACVANAQYNNHHSESWIAVDPTNPQHLVAMSKFFFDPQFYLFHLGAYVSRDGGLHWTDAIVPGFDCQTAPKNSWVDTTDPVLAFDTQGNVYSAFLPYSFKYNPDGHQVWGVVPNDAIFVVKSTDGGDSWTTANQGAAIAIYNSSGLGRTADKQWITVDSNPTSPFANNIYVGWTVFTGIGNDLRFSRSTDRAAHFSTPVKVTSRNNDGPFNQFIMMGTAPDGTLYAGYTSFPSNTRPIVDVWVLKSSDGGLTFSAPILAASFKTVSTAALANTSFRDGIADSFTVSPANGHLLLALEVDSGNGIDVQLTESLDGGMHWTTPVNVNDPSTVHDGTDQFQPTISASRSGTVAVAFYDRRLACPSNDGNILPGDAGRTNFCINTTIQFYTDVSQGLQIEGSNIRVSTATWDPQNPGSTTGQLPTPFGPTSSLTFIGDYFGLALSDTAAYVLSVSNHDSGQNPSHDQQQFLGIVQTPLVHLVMDWRLHLAIYDASAQRNITVPAGIGVSGGLWFNHTLDVYGPQGYAPLSTRDTSGTIYVQSVAPRLFVLSEFFSIWGQAYNETCVGLGSTSYCSSAEPPFLSNGTFLHCLSYDFPPIDNGQTWIIIINATSGKQLGC